MISLITQGHYLLFALLAFALIISLTFHEFGHAYVAKLFGDDTAERAGRLTLNPLAHIDPFGFLMVVFVGFGYARPVPTDPRNYRTKSADLWVSAAGPFMNLVVATVALNFYLIMVNAGVEMFTQESAEIFFFLLVKVNLLLMVFNLIPIGPLDGHYILPYFLPDAMARAYRDLNDRFGAYALLVLILLSFAGIPIFTYVSRVGDYLMPLIAFV